MKSRRVHRVRSAQKRARDVLDTYRNSSRGLVRVFESIVPESDGRGRAVAARAAHHLAEVEAFLPHLREAIRSCRYPGAENGDTGALVWGLWGQLSETSAHLRGAIDSLEKIGARMASGGGATRKRRTGRKERKATRGAKRPKRKARAKPKKASGAARKGRGPARKGGRKTGTKRKARRSGGR